MSEIKYIKVHENTESKCGKMPQTRHYNGDLIKSFALHIVYVDCHFQLSCLLEIRCERVRGLVTAFEDQRKITYTNTNFVFLTIIL